MTSWDKKYLIKARTAAEGIFPWVSEISPTAINGYVSFFIPPDGSKEGWKESTEGDPPVTFDNCSRGDGMWFDKGELASILAQGAKLADVSEVAAFLREVFPTEAPAE